MRYAVALYFDPQGERLIRSLWKEIASSQHLPAIYEVHPGSRPHISLAVYADLDQVNAVDAVDTLAHRHQPFELTLSRFLSFSVPGSTTGTVYWAPDPSPALSTIHEDLHASFSGVGSGLSKYYLPGQWPAHCALLTQIELDRSAGVIESLEQDHTPVVVGVRSLGFAEFHPVRILHETEIGRDRMTASTPTD